jgi:hypothetical protein
MVFGLIFGLVFDKCLPAVAQAGGCVLQLGGVGLAIAIFTSNVGELAVVIACYPPKA